MSQNQLLSLSEILNKTISKDADRIRIKSTIKTVLQELPFFKRLGVKLQTDDPSFKLRYRYAVDFWENRTENNTITKEQANNLIEVLREELNSKECFYSESEETNLSKEYSDKYFFKKTSTKGKGATKQGLRESKEKLICYVTCKCESKFYVKPADTCEAEVEIENEEILCSYELICPGDEVEVISTDTGGKRSLRITKSTGLSSIPREVKASFIQDLLKQSRDESSLTVYNFLCKRCQGIWDHLKNDEELLDDSQCVKDVWKLALLLSEKLSQEHELYCKTFLEDLSSSLLFINIIPQFIQTNAIELNSDDICGLKSLLELMMRFAPQTATKTWKVAKCLANAMHMITNRGNATEDECPSVEYLVHLGNILAKSIPGCQEVDTTNCEWNELPTIPTEREIFTEFDLNSLEAIKCDKPYESTEQYLDINYRLLREECFRNLCTGIQDFRERNSYDTRRMKMYRITLDTIYRDSDNFLVLNCEDYEKKSKDSSEESEDTSDEILYGSLMCISLNKKFDTLTWATVVKYEMQQNSDKKTVSVKLCSDRNKRENIEVLLALSALKNEDDYALMAESPTFFRAFGPSMDRLKEMHEKNDMPLEQELVKAKKSEPPAYALDKEQKCDWSILFEIQTGCEFKFPEDLKLNPIEQYKHLKENNMSQSLLDETQLLAIDNFLENKVSLIQGPPGTGKSYLGVKILRLMLSMQIHKRFGGPILVMTYKNAALDHFLEPCLEYTSNIVRIGTTKNEELAKINLKNVDRWKGISREIKVLDREATEQMRSSRSKLKSLFKCLSNPVFTLQSFFKAASESNIRSLLTMSPDVNQNISEDLLDDLLSKWKQENVPKRLKELVKTSLNLWLPKAKIKEKYRSYKKKKHDSVERVSTSTKNNEEECSDDAIDKKVEARERQQDAVEHDYIKDDSKDLDMSSKTKNEDEPLIEDLYIPFVYKNDAERVEYMVYEHQNLWRLSEDERIDYICALQCKIIHQFSDAVNSFDEGEKRHQGILDNRTVEILKEYDVIGMTTTGAATRLHLLNQLKPCAVIVEEAAEIIEGQLVSVLPPTIQHLVMLGDQEQLRPRISCYKLKTKKYLDCSMFERLINNKMPFQQLGQQCRMRDDIADLLRSLNIYNDLKTNDEKTRDNNPPDCTGLSLYFVKHTAPERQSHGSSSVWNQREISLILEVAENLIKNGYPASGVTVLCPYRGQVDKMKAAFKTRSVEPSEEYLNQLKDINITTVDSFQGEENKVILLSLVRSNKEQKIGFFGVRNRICVAVSRAECALYMFGNISVYSTSQNWKKIIDVLEQRQKIGTKFPFKEDCDGVSPKKDDKPFCDTTKLSPREINWLSKRIVSVWEYIAGEANLDEYEVANVKRDNVQYQEPVLKAAQILKMISSKQNFSRQELGNHLRVEELHDLVDPVLTGNPGSDVVDSSIVNVTQ